MSMETANAARGRWPGILQELGIGSQFLVEKQGPCPMCQGKTRFRFPDDMNGRWFCNRCGNGDGFNLLQLYHGWDFKKAAAEVDRVVGNIPQTTIHRKEMTDAERRERLRKTVASAFQVRPGDPVWKYLSSRCGDPSGFVHDIRFHPGLKHSIEGGHHPAMLAMLRYADGSGASVHRTYLTADGRKAQVDPVRKMMTGFPLAGSAVRLGPVEERLGIAEGIETAICASKMFGLPVWAATSANGMIAWEPPQGVRSVVIFGDCDASFTGQQAAFTLAKRLVTAGFAVDVEIPQLLGSDWADVQMGKVA